MKEHLMHGIVKTMMDGVKDAHMQYEYAVSAWEHGEHELATKHADEARARLLGAKAWRDLRVKYTDAHPDALVKAMEDEWCDWYHSVEGKINTLFEKMGRT